MTLQEAKRAFEQANAALDQLNKQLVTYLEQEGFPQDRSVPEEELERLCQRASSFLPQAFLKAYQAYRDAAHQLKQCGLLWMREHGTQEQVSWYEQVIALPYLEEKLLDVLLQLPEE